ncbi:UDP-N-acetylmuramate dehydrogenase [Hypnocyclicus thermotrophus]|uniref:UDP-N-acetylenolpyruvoylglucosamine reductase n=1 Tax=Hypnocyclicus thermotrophus TaxID=1627895 RepID=A0AA46DYH2_9FUSO|nr:UDP-N-acetylmuramate dehydrogenase [Hypnocyclicus thermotrophus]TDT69859.1 UDP-N-acetylmuramate dehydrogenase [Hypnocyclicus thermotrophus]
MEVIKNAKMKNHSNMKIGGEAKELIFIEKKEELLEVLEEAKDFFIIGNGTNTLIKDGKIDKTFITLKRLNAIKLLENNRVYVEAGLDFSKFIEFMEKNNLSGLENLAGIPGSVGGLVYMNGGAYGTEIFDYIEEIEIIDNNNNLRKIKKENIKYSYRATEIKEKKWIIISVIFKLEKGFNKEKVKELINKRENNHPLDLPNLGSTFKNPEGYYSAKLIIEAGIQGHKIGGARISKKHPNFIVNEENAKYSDVIKLIEYVKNNVKSKTGIELEEEIIIIK